MDVLRTQRWVFTPDVLDHLMSDDKDPRSSSRDRAAQASGGKRKTVVQKVINLALHYPRSRGADGGLASDWRR